MLRQRVDRLARVTPWVAFFAMAAVAVTWPLALNLRSALLGPPGGDTGVYVWNLWIFRHELMDHGRLPFGTDHIFGYTGPADFSLHNFTPVAGLMAIPLIPRVGVVGAFNLVLLAFLTLTGISVFALARAVGLSRGSAALAGTLFIAAPVITARETAHASLVAAWALPLFLMAFLRLLRHPSRGGSVLTGGLVAAAFYSDAYYGIYCILMAAFIGSWHFLKIDWSTASSPATLRCIRVLDGLVLLLGAFIVWRAATGSTAIVLGPVTIATRTLYTPTLLIVSLGGLRAWLTWRPSLSIDDSTGRVAPLARLGVLAVATTVLLLLPVLVGLGQRWMQNRLPHTPVFWRSSPRGVDLLSYLVPNPTHAWLGRWTERWLLPPNADAFPELVASFSIVGLVCIAVAVWQRCVPRLWVAFTVLFGLLSLGPFIHVAGFDTTVVGPWALLRYVPVIGMARAPARFAVVATLGLSLLLAFAVDAWRSRAGRRRPLLMAVLAAIAVEVYPGPRTLYSADVPQVHEYLATVPEGAGRILHLPTGIRDGASSLGNFVASNQFLQTASRHPMLGGYLSRVSPLRKERGKQVPMLAALFALSDGAGTLSDDVELQARLTADRFLARSCVKYVVVNKQLASNRLRAFAIDVLRLVHVTEDAAYELLTPRDAPACDPSPSIAEGGRLVPVTRASSPAGGPIRE